MSPTQLLTNVFSERAKTCFSDRSIDFILKPEQTDLTSPQKEYLAQRLDFPVSRIANIRQVHGEHVIVVTAEDLKGNGPLPEADAILTRVPDVPIAIRTADCLPIFIFDAKRNCLGLVHAGWRGSEKRIVVKALKHMREEWGCTPEDIQVVLGPCIRPCCYEVGEEFKQFFLRETLTRDGKTYFDLALANRTQLVKYGIKVKNIFDTGDCTCCDPSFFSYRREGQAAGRHLSLMVLKAN
jgi:polyphenol oxidase